MSAPQFTIEREPDMSLGRGWRWVVRRDGLRIASAGSRAEAKELLAQIKAREQMSAASTPGPWSAKTNLSDTCEFIMAKARPAGHIAEVHSYSGRLPDWAERKANARLIAAAPDHALVCWAMCVQDATWEEWPPEGRKGEFCFAGIRYVTELDEFGAPVITPPLRAALAKARGEP